MSGRIYENKTIGIAFVGTETKFNCGCAIKGNLLKLVKKNLFKSNFFEDAAKLYAICIYFIIRDSKKKINTLIICNDEDFRIVRKSLFYLLESFDFEIINISEFRKGLGRNVGSFADNYAKIYRRKALKPTRLSIGRELNVVKINYKLIKRYWEKLNKKE
jgi:hypothetical protein